jgi:hypothetical protein
MSPLARLARSLHGLGPLTVFALRAALRQRVLSLLGIVALVLLLGSLIFRGVEFGADGAGFLADFGLGVIHFFGAILAVLLVSLRWFEELNEGTLLPVLARPVARTSYYLAQFAGVLLVLVLFVGTLMLLLFALLAWRMGGATGGPGSGGGGALAGLLGLAALVELARLGLIAALTLLLASFARGALFAIVLSLLLVLAGQLLPVAEAMGEAMGPALALLLEPAGLVLPPLHLYAVDGRDLLAEGFSRGRLVGLGLHTVLYGAAYLGLGAWIFSRREL